MNCDTSNIPVLSESEILDVLRVLQIEERFGVFVDVKDPNVVVLVSAIAQAWRSAEYNMRFARAFFKSYSMFFHQREVLVNYFSLMSGLSSFDDVIDVVSDVFDEVSLFPVCVPFSFVVCESDFDENAVYGVCSVCGCQCDDCNEFVVNENFFCFSCVYNFFVNLEKSCDYVVPSLSSVENDADGSFVLSLPLCLDALDLSDVGYVLSFLGLSFSDDPVTVALASVVSRSWSYHNFVKELCEVWDVNNSHILIERNVLVEHVNNLVECSDFQDSSSVLSVVFDDVSSFVSVSSSDGSVSCCSGCQEVFDVDNLFFDGNVYFVKGVGYCYNCAFHGQDQMKLFSRSFSY